MKKFILSSLTASVLILAITSCRKEPVTEKTPQEKIIGKWLVDNRQSNEHYSGADHILTFPGNGADYADFRTDGKVYSDVSGSKDTMTYSVTSATVINIGGSNFDIKTFTDRNFVMYNKEMYGGGDYDEMTIALKK